MSLVVLFQALPMVAANGAGFAVRLAGGGDRPYVNYLGFNDWRAGLAGLPRFTTELGFDQNGWTGGALPQTAVVKFKGSDKALLSTLSGLFWKGARVVVSSGDDTFGAPAAWRVEMTGTVADCAIADGGLEFTISDLSGDLAKPAVFDTFAGTGGVEGGDDATGRLKRRTWGRAFNIEGRLIDKANNVFEFGDPTRPLQAFDMLKDKGRAGDMTGLAWQGSIAATFQALQAAVCPKGGGVVAASIAMAKWWTVPSGPLTADLRGEVLNGYAETPTDIASRIIATRSTINPALTLNASRTYAAGLHIDDDSETVANALDRLLLPVSLAWSLSPAGTITIDQWTWTGPVETLGSQTVMRETVFSPLSTRKLGYQRNQRVQTDAEISAVLLLATDATYADGTAIEVLKPAEAGANITENRTASAIQGQAAWATYSGLVPSTVAVQVSRIQADGYIIAGTVYKPNYGFLFDFFPAEGNANVTETRTAAAIAAQGALATKGSVTLNTTTITRADGTTIVSETLVITDQGTASAIAGQGTLATLNQTGTNEIAANAVSRVIGGTGDVVNVASNDTGLGVSLNATSSGGPIKIDVCFDATRTAGSGQCVAQLFATYGNQTVALSRQFNCPVATSSPPVAFFVNTTFPAGTAVMFQMRYTATNSAHQISGQAMTYTELKR